MADTNTAVAYQVSIYRSGDYEKYYKWDILFTQVYLLPYKHEDKLQKLISTLLPYFLFIL